MKHCGAPAMRESWTLIQSAPVVLSTTDQPCRVAVCVGAVSPEFGVGEEDAVGGLPDGDFGDVADVEVAGAGAVVLQGEVAEALVAVGGEEFEVAGDVGVEGGVEEADSVAGVSSRVRTSPESETTVRKRFSVMARLVVGAGGVVHLRC